MTRFLVNPESGQSGNGDQVLRVGKNLFTGESDLVKYFGSPLTSLEADLLRIASAVFAVDRAVQRGEDLARVLHLTVPVVNVGRLQPVKQDIENILFLLSHDAWALEFDQVAGDPERTFKKATSTGKTLLFSGGADSLAASLEFGDDMQLISHQTMNRSVNASQTKLLTHLAENGRLMRNAQIRVSSRSSEQLDHDVEESQRTRSFVFLVLGALAARRMSMHEIVLLAENGQMAVHLPLTHGRIGALSTHTAHPDVLEGMEGLLSQILGVSLSITNPYVYATKAEVVGRIVARLKSALWMSNSCWRSARLTVGTHCGECVPCFVRRVAIETHCLDKTLYARDPWREDVASLHEDDLARRNILDVAEFVVRFSKMQSEDIMVEWPELISQTMDAAKVIDMYRRFSVEAMTVFSRYPRLQPLLT